MNVISFQQGLVLNENDPNRATIYLNPTNSCLSYRHLNQCFLNQYYKIIYLLVQS